MIMVLLQARIFNRCINGNSTTVSHAVSVGMGSQNHWHDTIPYTVYVHPNLTNSQLIELNQNKNKKSNEETEN